MTQNDIYQSQAPTLLMPMLQVVLTSLSAFLSDATNQGKNEVTGSHNGSPVQITPLTPDDTPLTPDDFVSHVVGVTSPWIDLCSADPVIADVSRQVLQLELQYAAFCGITYVVISGPALKSPNGSQQGIAQFARAILDALGQGPYMQLFIWLPMIVRPETHKGEQMGDLAPFARARYIEEATESNELDLFGSWEAWDYIRSLCKYSTRLSVALSIPRLLPPTAIQSRWNSEPVRMLSLDLTTFTKNPKGYPVLTRAHQALISRFVHFKQPTAWFLLCEVGPIPEQNSGNVGVEDTTMFPSLAEASTAQPSKDPTPYLSYIRNLQSKQPLRSVADRFGAGYQDYLQAPLQPLTVNLESVTYEVFEKDPVKYEWYERAVARALSDWVEQGKPTSNPDGRVVVAVVGAGRGPLVTRALQASEAVGVEIDMWALEKNPNAFVLLQRHNQNRWDGQVTLVKSDMRTWRGPSRKVTTQPIRKIYNVDPEEAGETQIGQEDGTSATDISPLSEVSHYKIDILISELLGSFADNELSPECLDGVQHLMNPVHGISVPASYSAHITPIAAPKLHADISLSMIHTMPNAAEIPYVVMLNAIDFLSTDERRTRRAEEKVGLSSAGRSATSPSTVQGQQSSSAATAKQKEYSSHHPDSQAQAQPTTTTINPIIHETWSFHHHNPHLPPMGVLTTTEGSATANTTTTATNPTTRTTTVISTSSPSNAHNARHKSMTFPIPNRGTCHGLAGYFEAVLYPGVELSTNPLTMDLKSADMISWFPIYFPFKTPLSLPDDSTLQVSMWRQTDDRKVWYEWIADVYVDVDVTCSTNNDASTNNNNSNNNNDNARKGRQRRRRMVRVGGSELHSSEKEACLM